MSGARVVITGMGLASPIGNTLEAARAALERGESGVRLMPDWGAVDGLLTRVAAPVAPGLNEAAIPRGFRRTMGPQAMFAAAAAQAAIQDSGLDERILGSGQTGLAIGSTMGSAASLHEFFGHLFEQRTVAGVKGTSFFQCMGHTAAANLALLFGITGRVTATVSACTSGSQAIGAGYEWIRAGAQDVVIAGGADEAHFTAAATFDVMRGTSLRFHETPERTPRPFDADRDGLVIGEGSGIVVLERLEHARARDARIHAEVIGYATTCDGHHMSQPEQEGMERCMRRGLDSAGLAPAAIDYINAHATATPVGDAVEAAAVRAVFGARVPISSTKGQTGHTLGACGALETIFTVLMMQGGFAAGTRNLDRVDDACAGLLHLTRREALSIRTALNNNFAFGGVNTSIVLRRFEG